MRLCTFEQGQEPQVGVVQAETVIPLAALGRFPATMLGLIAAGQPAWQALRQALAGDHPAGLPLNSVHLLAPIPRPPKNVICLGLNYAAHAQESAAARGQVAKPLDYPVVFTKAGTSVNGPYDPIPYDPAVSVEIDWEAELGVVIGRPGRGISAATALDHVFGYTIINDVTARDIQRQHKQYFLGKSLDGACPIGPWIVTADEIPDPQQLRLRTLVNGQLKQDGHTAHQIFNVATTISILSRGMTLEAGDVIATGTPEGVGFARTPPEFLRPGDVVQCEIEAIGHIRNVIRQA